MAKARRKLAAVRHVGFLLATNPDAWEPYIKKFEAALPNDVKVTYLPPQGTNGDPQAIADTAAYLAKYFEVVVTAGTAAALALKTATATTNAQFVYASAGDPAGSGLNPQPGGKFTGGSNQQVALVQRRIDRMLGNPGLFKENFAVVGNHENPPDNQPTKAAMDKAFDILKAARPGKVHLRSITPSTTIQSVINDLATTGNSVKSLYVCSDPDLTLRSKELNDKAHAAGMKTMFEFEEHKTKHGGDDFDGVDFKDLFRQAAGYVKRILDGDKAGDLPIFTFTQLKAPANGKNRAYAAKKRSPAPKSKK